MGKMFYGCQNLTELEIGANFNITDVTKTDVTKKDGMLYNCDNLPEETQNKILNKNQITPK